MKSDHSVFCKFHWGLHYLKFKVQGTKSMLLIKAFNVFFYVFLLLFFNLNRYLTFLFLQNVLNQNVIVVYWKRTLNYILNLHHHCLKNVPFNPLIFLYVWCRIISNWIHSMLLLVNLNFDKNMSGFALWIRI